MRQVQINHGRIATVKGDTIKRTSWSIWAGEITAATKVCPLLFKKKKSLNVMAAWVFYYHVEIEY